MENIRFVTGIHGNEPVPVLALASIGEKQLIANPKALSLRKRFVEKDLNSSFGTRGKTYEERRARKLLKEIRNSKIVVDLHTFSAVSEPFVVVVDLKMIGFAKTLGLKHIVYMKHNIKKGRALINYRDGVSVEVGNHKDPKSFERAVDLVKKIKLDKFKKSRVKVYEVFGIIDKKGKYHNFRLYKSKQESFYPVLAGEKAYDFYGLKAKILKAL